MPRVSVLGVKDKMDFPDDMSSEAIREFLRQKFNQERMSFTNPDLTPQPQRIEAYEPSLREKMSSGISSALQKSGLVSNNYQANKTGENLTALAEFLPGVGDVVDANDFGIAAASGDIGGMAMAGLGIVPVVGDAAQKGLRAFHGTPNKFDLFDINKIGSTSDTGMFGRGFYFTDDKGLAKTYAKKDGRVIEADLDLKNPYIINSKDDIPEIDVPDKTMDDLLNSDVNYSRLFTEKLQSQGYDGVVSNMSSGGRQFVVFDPKAIKQVKPDLPMAMAGLGIVPVDGDAAQKGLKKITSYSDLFEFSPKQLSEHLRLSKPDSVINGDYIERSGAIEKVFKPDGSINFIKDGEILRKVEPGDAKEIMKNKIMKIEVEKPEVMDIIKKRREDDKALLYTQKALESDSYRIQHSAPMRGDYPGGDNLSDVFGDDIYTRNALQYFGTGKSYDNKALNVIREMKGNPDKQITIFRSTPKTVKDINSGDWVTTTKEYARDHMEGEKEWHIISKKVRAKDIATDGNSIHEFGFDPDLPMDKAKSKKVAK